MMTIDGSKTIMERSILAPIKKSKDTQIVVEHSLIFSSTEGGESYEDTETLVPKSNLDDKIKELNDMRKWIKKLHGLFEKAIVINRLLEKRNK